MSQRVMAPGGTTPWRLLVAVVVSLAVLHMGLFASLTSLGLMYVSAGRTVLVAYTTPLWVFPLAWLFAGEALTGQRLVAIACGMLGLALLVNPLAIAWNDSGVVTGHALILLAAVCWAISQTGSTIGSRLSQRGGNS